MAGARDTRELPSGGKRYDLMATQIICPNCGKSGTIPDNLLGKKGHCKACMKSFVFASSESPEHVYEFASSESSEPVDDNINKNNDIVTNSRHHTFLLNYTAIRLLLAFLSVVVGIFFAAVFIAAFEGQPRSNWKETTYEIKTGKVIREREVTARNHPAVDQYTDPIIAILCMSPAFVGFFLAAALLSMRTCIYCGTTDVLMLCPDRLPRCCNRGKAEAVKEAKENKINRFVEWQSNYSVEWGLGRMMWRLGRMIGFVLGRKK